MASSTALTSSTALRDYIAGLLVAKFFFTTLHSIMGTATTSYNPTSYAAGVFTNATAVAAGGLIGAGWAVGNPIRAFSIANPTEYIDGVVAAYNSGAGTISITKGAFNGNTARTDWAFCPLNGAATYAAPGGAAGTELHELPNANGYTPGGALVVASGPTAGVIGMGDKVWTQSTADLVAGYNAMWVSNTNAAGTVGASLVCVSYGNPSMTASGGGTITSDNTNPITIPTAA